jgi:adenylyltransferase/sulfurtransferase
MLEDAYYSRQMRLPELGSSGQEALRAAKVLVVGAGGLGSTALMLLASAGVGTIGIAEHDRLEASNLHRQILYSAKDVEQPKAILAADRLRALNPFIQINVITKRIEANNALAIVCNYDFILDCTDNFATKYLLNDAAYLQEKTLVQASLYRFEGQILTIDPNSDGGCLRCLWPEPPTEGLIGDCAEVGVMGTLPAMFGAWQAHEAIKHIVRLPTLTSSLLSFDSLTMTSTKLERHKRHDCILCGTHPTIHTLTTKPSRTLEYIPDASISRDDLLQQFRWVDVREREEIEIAPLPEAIHLPFRSFDPDECPYDKQTPLLIICAHGMRSRSAAETLRQRGWTHAVSLTGGIGNLPKQDQAAA